MKIDSVISVELSRMPCNQLSTVWKQSFRGSYDTPYRSAAAPGVIRQRFLSTEDGQDPRELLRQGERESRLLTVEAMGAYWPVRGARATVETQGFGTFEDCPVRSARYTRDSRGERTKLVLEGGIA